MGFRPVRAQAVQANADGDVILRVDQPATNQHHQDCGRMPPPLCAGRNAANAVGVPTAFRLPHSLPFDSSAQWYYNGAMKQVIALKLEPSPEQANALLAVMEAFNAAASFVAAVAFEKRISNKLVIQPLVYGQLREHFGLSSQLAIRAIAKAIEAYKRDKTIQPAFRAQGAIVYDERILAYKGLTHVSLMTLGGRQVIPVRFGAYQESRLSRVKGQADLVYREGRFFLYATVEMPTPPPIEPVGVLGVDLGIVELATDSEGNSYSGEGVTSCRRRLREHRRHLQRRQTNSAKKRLRKLSGRQARFVRTVNHCISKQIVQSAVASQKALALEALEGIRQRSTELGREMRWLLGNWSFAQLRQYVTYKAEAAGIPVFLVDPRNTSRTCSRCGYCDKSNRKTQAHFKCLCCGFEGNADANAARNIEARAEQSWGLLSSAYARP